MSNETALVERLRDYAKTFPETPVHEEAADTIASLLTEVEGLRAALEGIAETFERDIAQGYRTKDKTFAIEIARQALEASR